MRLVIKNRTICIFSLCVGIFFNAGCINKTTEQQVQSVTMTPINKYTTIDNEEICSYEKSGGFSPINLRILKENNLEVGKHNWSGPFSICYKAYSTNLTNAYIHQFVDENSLFYGSNRPLNVIILLDRTNNKYLLAKVERENSSQFISDGKINYMGSLKDMAEAKAVLNDFISNQTQP